MAKKKARHTGGRADKLRRRAARAGKQHPRQHPHHHEGLVHVGPVPDNLDLTGWHVMGPGDDFDELDDLDFVGPGDALLDTSRCPVADACAGCGGTTGLHAVTSAFSRPGGYDVACATLCHSCDGRSFLHLLDPAALEAAFHRHTTHPQPEPIAAAEKLPRPPSPRPPATSGTPSRTTRISGRCTTAPNTSWTPCTRWS